MNQRNWGQTRLLRALEKMEGTAAQKRELISKLKAAGLLHFEAPEDIAAAMRTCEDGDKGRTTPTA